jgi:hypothetical protein
MAIPPPRLKANFSGEKPAPLLDEDGPSNR